MPKIFLNGREVEAKAGSTVIEVARAEGHDIPCFCWHKSLSVAGNCRLCVVEAEEGGWLDIACNMPVSEGLKVLTDSPKVKEHRQMMLELLTLNHPIDCGICDKAGECKLQDYYYEHNGAPSTSVDKKVRLTKFVALSDRIVLDNERCVLCTRCVRFTDEVSKSHGLGIVGRGDHALVRAAENGAFASDAYSDNVVDLCPVGALQSRQFLASSRVWYLTPTASICPGCERGCNVDIWHRSYDWKLNAPDQHKNFEIARVTPRENEAVNGPWICNTGRDLAALLDRPRATQAFVDGNAVPTDDAVSAARKLIARARRPLAIVSSWASNEELAAFRHAFGNSFTVRIKQDRVAAPGEVVADDFLIRADKNPNTAGARAVFPDASPWTATFDAAALQVQYDLVLVWGDGFDVASVRNVPVVCLNAYDAPSNAKAAVFVPVSAMTERGGHYTNCEGQVGAFEACFAKPQGVVDAQELFARLVTPVAETVEA